MNGRSRPLSLLTCVVIVAVAACSSSSSSSRASAGGGPPGGSLQVFAAASLTGAFTAAKSALSAGRPSVSVTYNFGGSNTLASQILQGATPDVFASADGKNMQRLVAVGLVERPVTFARNKLELAVAAGNPKHVTGLADLANPGVSVVLEAVGVPAGDYARQVLAAHGITVRPRSLETDVKSALAKVTSGEADATVVYVTDVVAAGRQVVGVPLPDPDQPLIAYPIAVLKSTPHRAAAEAFVASALSGDVQRALESAGFLPPR